MPDIYAEALSRDATEVQRMEHQFHIITEALGWTIHPSIAAKLPVSPAIADFATGPGLFPCTVVKDHPNARLDGYDISPAMFPVQSELPSNVRLHTLDVKEPLPAELHDVYDLIHVRYLTVGMEPEEWYGVLRNLLRGLKSGGAIQWIEPAVSQMQFVRGRPDSTTTALTRMSDAFQTEAVQRRFSSGWNTLPDLMKQAGLDVETDIVSTDRLPESRRALTENGKVALFSAARRINAAGLPGAMATEAIDRLEVQAADDIESGCYARYDIHTAIGFKS
nr:n-methyltransferase sirn [Quercus suber]